jgi:hypothetical protein
MSMNRVLASLETMRLGGYGGGYGGGFESGYAPAMHAPRMSTASVSSISSVSSSGGASNSWNAFQHAHAGQGLSRSQMSALYKQSKR